MSFNSIAWKPLPCRVCCIFSAASDRRTRYGNRGQAVYPRPKNMPYSPSWREEEHREYMIPESSTLPTCECACVCGGRRSCGRWRSQSHPHYLHVSVRACVCVWREEELWEVKIPESSTLPTCECACVRVFVEGGGAPRVHDLRVIHTTYMWMCVRACVCGGRRSTESTWSQSHPHYLDVSVRACVRVCVESGYLDNNNLSVAGQCCTVTWIIITVARQCCKVTGIIITIARQWFTVTGIIITVARQCC